MVKPYVCTGGESERDSAQAVNNSVTPQRPLSTSQLVATDHHPTAVSCTARPGEVPRGSAAAHVTTFQITPTLRQRAFPRTNPAYVGTYRRDGLPPAYRRIDSSTSTTLGVASELHHHHHQHHHATSPATALNHRRPNSDGVQRALIQHTADVVYVSNAAGARRLTSNSSGGHQCMTVMAHQRLNDRPSSTSSSGGLVMRRLQSEGSGGGAGTAAVHVVAADCRTCSNDAAGPPANRCPHDVRMSATTAATRRQSEPDYVNVMNRQHHHQQQQQPGGCYVDDGDCMTELVPSAIYMNQHELAIAGRYTSRSTCNFMDPTANGNSLYTVYQKSIPDIFDCNLKINYQILIIFVTNISDTTGY